MTKPLFAAGAVLCSLAALPAVAQTRFGNAADLDAPGWYGGLEVGTARSSFGSDNVSDVLGQQGLTASGTSVDRTDTDWSLYAGYRFTRNLSLEGGYVDLGRRNFNTNVAAPGTGTLSGHSHPQGVFLRAVGTVPLSNGWSVFGRAGIVDIRSHLSGVGTGSAGTFEDNTRWHTNATFGVGVGWTLNRNVDLLLAIDRWNGLQPDYAGKSFHIDTVNVGLKYRF